MLLFVLHILTTACFLFKIGLREDFILDRIIQNIFMYNKMDKLRYLELCVVSCFTVSAI